MESRLCKGRSVRYRSTTESLSTRRLRFCSPTDSWSCSGGISWRRQESHPTTPSGGGSSGSVTKGLREEPTFLVDNQQAGRVTQKGHNGPLEAWREQVEEARRGQGAGRNLARGLSQESAEAYKDFLDSIFFYYGESARAAEKGTREG